MQGTRKRRKISSPAVFSDVTRRLMEESFWFGYRRGLNRFRFGKIFAADEQFRPVTTDTIASHDIATLEEFARSMGYHIGARGLSVEEAAEEYKEFLREIEEP